MRDEHDVHASLDERVRLLETRLALMQELLVSLVDVVKLLTKPRKEQTA